MAPGELIRLITESLYLVLYVSAPALAVAFAVGLLVSTLSAAVHVHEQSLSFVPRLVGVSLVLALAGGWMTRELVVFTDHLWRAIPALVP